MIGMPTGPTTWYIQSESGGVDVEDAAVVAIKRNGGSVRVSLDAVRVLNADGFELVQNVDLVFHGVALECATRHLAGGRSELCSSSGMPLDRIEVAEHAPPQITLEGYRGGESWFTWVLEANSVALETREIASRA
jgi:hypothetical protein